MMREISFEELMRQAAHAKAQRAAAMPTEQDAIRAMNQAHQRLIELGYRDAVYCPKDGSTFLTVSPNSTGIHETVYWGTWPTGLWWILDAGDMWPARPVLFKQVPREADVSGEAREGEAR